MARFGILLSQDGVWNGITVQSDVNYLNDMRTPSQTLNNSYGYLTWLNGQSSFMLPSSQLVFPGSAIPSAPSDMYAALGKNGQIINVVPSQGLVIVRMGYTMGNSYVGNQYNDTIWQHINNLGCAVGIAENAPDYWSIQTNPASDFIVINGLNTSDLVELYTPAGQKLEVVRNNNALSVSTLPRGMYFVRTENRNTGEVNLSSIEIIKNATTYMIDPVAKTGLKMENPFGQNNIGDAKEALGFKEERKVKMLGSQLSGTEILIGKKCDVYKDNADEMAQTTYIHKGLILKTIINMDGDEIISEATDIQFNIKIPADKFEIPKGIIF